jgi:rubrerythrin
MTDPEPPASSRMLTLLEAARRAEKEQALVYRSLAARAEAAGEASLASRFHDLHADEQHHLSRITARLLELSVRPPDLTEVPARIVSLDGWEAVIRAREGAEVDRYVQLLDEDLDAETRRVIQEILEVEEQHASELGGKWTKA